MRCSTVYCPEHRKNGKRELSKVQRKIYHDIQKEKREEVITFNCSYCGKAHSAPRYLLNRLKLSSSARQNWDNTDRLYCCVEHMKIDIHNHTRCEICGKLLAGTNFSDKLCSQECRDKSELQKLHEYTCENCGKTFYRKRYPAYFCGASCRAKAFKNGWVSPNQHYPQVVAKDTFKCAVCGKSYTLTWTDPKKRIDYLQLSKRTCSDDCSKAYSSTRDVERKAAKAKFAEEKKKKKSNDRESRLARRSPNEPLCSSCKVSYRDCERMQSGFRVLPKGARYDANGILSTCPKYM